ncbi:TetR/AcrR family transcriptional regulator [Ralstonia insidiosa]|uniref:TetR/AcrR family transcriptional regulator n=1 Tax=Ralstonia insidiosa TaxID=190721 RepID=UPI003211B594
MLQKAIRVFWRKGFAATSTDELLQEMGIGRQSLYNAFGDKRQLYLEVLRSYMEGTFGGHLERLNKPKSPLQGIRRLLLGLAAPDDDERALGCLGVGSAGEFGTRDPELLAQLQSGSQFLRAQLVKRIREGQESGEVDPSMDAQKAAEFVQMVMNGLQLAARTGADVRYMHDMANFAIDRLKAD